MTFEPTAAKTALDEPGPDREDLPDAARQAVRPDGEAAVTIAIRALAGAGRAGRAAAGRRGGTLMTRLLIVEDEVHSANALAYYFRDEGYEVEVAGRTDEALAAAERRPPDVLLTDVVLPGDGDGLTVARTLQQRDPGLPVVAMSGLPEIEVRQRAEGVRLHDLCSKPLRLRPAGPRGGGGGGGARRAVKRRLWIAVVVVAALIAVGVLGMLWMRGLSIPPPLAPAPAPGPSVEAPPPDRMDLAPAGFDSLPGWDDDPVAAALPALLASCAVFELRPGERPMGGAGVAGSTADWHDVCRAAADVPRGDDAAARAFFEQRFLPWAVSNRGDEAGLFTGYYEPTLHGSRRRHGRFRVPLYSRPPELVSVDLGAVPRRPRRPAHRRPRRRRPAGADAGSRRDRRRRAGRPRPGGGVGRRSGRRLLPPHPGLRARRARRRQCAAPRLRRPERPPLPRHRPRAGRARRPRARPRCRCSRSAAGSKSTRTGRGS